MAAGSSHRRRIRRKRLPGRPRERCTRRSPWEGAAAIKSSDRQRGGRRNRCRRIRPNRKEGRKKQVIEAREAAQGRKSAKKKAMEHVAKKAEKKAPAAGADHESISLLHAAHLQASMKPDHELTVGIVTGRSSLVGPLSIISAPPSGHRNGPGALAVFEIVRRHHARGQGEPGESRSSSRIRQSRESWPCT